MQLQCGTLALSLALAPLAVAQGFGPCYRPSQREVTLDADDTVIVPTKGILVRALGRVIELIARPGNDLDGTNTILDAGIDFCRDGLLLTCQEKTHYLGRHGYPTSGVVWVDEFGTPTNVGKGYRDMRPDPVLLLRSGAVAPTRGSNANAALFAQRGPRRTRGRRASWGDRGCGAWRRHAGHHHAFPVRLRER